MTTEQILQLLIAERDRLNRAIEALQGPVKRRGRPPANPFANAPDWVQPAAKKAPAKKKAKRTFSPEQREAAADRMKARWANKKTAKKKG